MPSLTRDEAVTRAGLVRVEAMEVDLDLTRGPEHFGSRTVIRFACAEPGAETFVDLKAVEVARLRLNGVDLDLDRWRDGRVALAELAAANVLEVEATMPYSRDGQGLHRFVDPADERTYVYGHLFLDRAPAVFACFDQPDLKAPYTVTVTAPEDWFVVGNGAESRAGNVWSLATTQPLATYFVTVCAGPYAVVRAEHDGIPLALYGRASLESELRAEAEQMLAVTRSSFDAYHRLFGIRYPFGKYDQVFVPEFNAGAMENPGCVTFRDTYLFRGAVSHEELVARSNTIAHEMAHMWFGDLVTMRWWDDLWLNESFAEYMAYRVLTGGGEFPDAWVEFSIVRKLWGYAAERAPSTHPVAGSPAPDAHSALQNFDGISYAKGASVLRQLIAHLGDEAFVAGVTAYLRDHAFGNGELAEFLAAMSAAAGRDLTAWSRAWLETAGADTIGTELGGWVVRTPPTQWPADRPHTFDVAGFTDGEEVFRVPVTVTQDRTQVPALAEAPSAKVVVPNASDLTWATVDLAPATLGALAGQLGRVPDDGARAVVWTALLGGVARGGVDPRLALDVFTAEAPQETNDSVLSRVAAALVDRVIPCFLPVDGRESALGRVAGVAVRVLREAEGGSARALVAARLLARTTSDEDRLRAWLAGRHLPSGLEGDRDFRWLVVRNLAAQGLLDEDGIETVRREDDTLSGRLAALGARAAIPEVSSKGWAWTELTRNRAVSNYESLALAGGFWQAPDPTLVGGYVDQVPDAVARMAAWMGDDALERTVKAFFPRTMVSRETAAMAERAMAREDVGPSVRRALADQAHELAEALRSRATFG
jgi:aminopeptidase N